AEKLTDYLCRNGSWIDLSKSDDSDENTKSSSSMAPGSSSVIPSESEKSSSSFNKDKYTDENLVVKKRSILGVAQKGPFKFGSPVYLRELSEETLDPTGMVYEDEISSNKGDFVIPNVNLISPYAGVEVRGQYRNEVTGEYSKDSISLFVLTDLKTDSRTKVNINLLTHLEYKRAMYLVRKGYSVYAAKKQADQEIMTAFELPTTVKYSEDLSVFEDSEDDNVDYANASLMMLNLLFLGNRSDTEIKIAIDRFIVDIEKDGSWEDDSTKAVMADFATEIDGDEIRANVKSWNILDVPRFEAQVEMFWNNVYGLGGCTSVRSGVIAQNKNKYSKNVNSYYLCKSSSWKKITNLEADTYGWEAGETGEVKKGTYTEAKYVYRGGAWTEADAVESALGSCTASDAKTIKNNQGSYYVCEDTQWKILTTLEADTYGWSAGAVGEVKKGNVTDARYVYRDGTWTEATALEYDTYGYTCSKDGIFVSGKVNENNKYVCDDGSFRIASSDEIEVGTGCGKDGTVVDGSVSTVSKYVCDGGSFRIASSDEIELNLGCTSYTRGKIITTLSNVSVEERWVCSDEWKFHRFGFLKDSRDNKTYRTVTIGDQTWMAENLNYDYNEGTAKSYCYNNNPDSCAKYGRLYTWTAAMDSAAVFSTTGKGCGYGKTCSASGVVRGVCPEGWHLPSGSEFETLMKTVGSSVAATKLKSTYGWKSGNGTDDYGFSALPAGLYNGGFSNVGSNAYFWSATERSASYAYYWDLYASNAYLYYNLKGRGFSVRCLQDQN
ncbi:MAG: fibrobacter succinogenes major paralogous domain-containing protein, partial [Bacteroidales bacterium]|nr:fibrobacter succinogenes major paralogous domain-containing protein [Bacteroidales bacterium]